MGPYREDGFPKRSRGTVALFPELNREALAQVYELVSGEGKGERKGGGSFARLYGEQMRACGGMSPELRRKVQGSWVRYEQSADERRSGELAASLQPWGTGWCTAGESTAHMQLAGGDFWVYRTADGSGKHVVPRIAIRMQEGRVAEVRGVGKAQEMVPEMVEIAGRKVAELPGGERYVQITADMKQVTALERQLRAEPHAKLDTDTLRFLYGVDRKIVGFGHGPDPRVRDLQALRKPKEDLAQIFNTTPVHISLTREEALSGGIVYHHGDLDLNTLTAVEGLTLPQRVGGSLFLDGLTSADGLTLPREVGDWLSLPELISGAGITFPRRVGGSLRLNRLTKADGVTLPREVGGSLHLGSLPYAKGLVFPTRVGGSVSLMSLTSGGGLVLPEEIGETLWLGQLGSARGMTFPQKVGGSVFLDRLTSADWLALPNQIGRTLELGGLTSANGLMLPREIGESLYLSRLASAEGLNWPQMIGGDLILRSLSSPTGLTLPEEIGGSLDLSQLASAEGLAMSQKLGGSLNLFSLTSGTGLTLPRELGGDLVLNSLAFADGLVLPERVGKSVNLRRLTSAKGLTLPKVIGGYLFLHNLASLSGIVLPDMRADQIVVNSALQAELKRMSALRDNAIGDRGLV